MARVKIVKPGRVDDPVIQEIFDWVTQIEGQVPNHFYVEMNFPELFKAKLGATKVLWQMGELRGDEILYVGIAVSKANGCSYCTGAFCTILNYGFKTDEETVKKYVVELTGALADERTRTIVEFALKVNADPAGVTDDNVSRLRKVGLTDKGIVQLCHLVGDFASYNRLNIALQTDYDYSKLWRQLAFGDKTTQKAD